MTKEQWLAIINQKEDQIREKIVEAWKASLDFSNQFSGYREFVVLFDDGELSEVHMLQYNSWYQWKQDYITVCSFDHLNIVDGLSEDLTTDEEKQEWFNDYVNECQSEVIDNAWHEMIAAMEFECEQKELYTE